MVRAVLVAICRVVSSKLDDEEINGVETSARWSASSIPYPVKPAKTTPSPLTPSARPARSDRPRLVTEEIPWVTNAQLHVPEPRRKRPNTRTRKRPQRDRDASADVIAIVLVDDDTDSTLRSEGCRRPSA
jgi:hypothetical protein